MLAITYPWLPVPGIDNTVACYLYLLVLEYEYVHVYSSRSSPYAMQQCRGMVSIVVVAWVGDLALAVIWHWRSRRGTGIDDALSPASPAGFSQIHTGMILSIKLIDRGKSLSN